MTSPHKYKTQLTYEDISAELGDVLGSDATNSSVESFDRESASKKKIDDLALVMSRQRINLPVVNTKSPIHNEIHPARSDNKSQLHDEGYIGRSRSFDHESGSSTQFHLDLSEVSDDFDHGNFIHSPKQNAAKLLVTPSKKEKDMKTKTYKRVQKELGKQKIIHQNEIKEMTEKHSEEIEEILNQLNQVEIEFQDQLGSLESQLSKKNVMLEALGDQLTEQRKINEALKEEIAASNKQNFMLQESLDIANGAVNELKLSIVNIENEFNGILDSEREEHQMEIQRVQNEIAKEAERQFSEANNCYVTLKKDFDILLSERDEMDSEIEVLNKRIENDGRRRKSDEASLYAEIAQLKSQLASSSAEVANNRKEFTAEMESMSERESMLRLQLKELKAGFESSKISLSSTIQDNEKLRKENCDLQSVCEELMTLVEGDPSA